MALPDFFSGFGSFGVDLGAGILKGIMFAVVYVDQLVGYSFAPCHVVLKFNEPVKPEEGYLLIHKSHESYNSFLDNLRIVSKTQNFVLMEVIQYLKQ